jgi:hypothetical protein
LLVDDQETVLRTLEAARSILSECIAGQRGSAMTVERPFDMLNKGDVVQALDRMSRRRILRLIDHGEGPPTA